MLVLSKEVNRLQEKSLLLNRLYKSNISSNCDGPAETSIKLDEKKSDVVAKVQMSEYAESSIVNRQSKVLNASSIPIMRDNQDNYKPLERHFGTLIAGMSFGESFMLEDVERSRFFNAIAMTDCKILSLS